MTTIKAGAVLLHQHGGPEMLQWEEIEVGDPGPGEVRLSQTAVGLNFSETRTRAGGSATHANNLPLILGREAAGIVDTVGEGVTGVKPGQRVAYGLRRQQGAYTESRLVAAHELVPLPDDVTEQTAAAVMVKGMTACYLCRRTFLVGPGQTILVHAAAGGVGSILCQWASHLGATVIGTVSTEAKAAYAKAHGCDYPILYTQENFTERVREITKGEGVHVVYDPVGKDTWEGSLHSLRPRGYLVNYGWASGRVTELEPLDLMDLGSLYVTKTALLTYTSTPEEMQALAKEVLEIIQSGGVTIDIGQSFPLREASKAHQALESRATVGATVLMP